MSLARVGKVAGIVGGLLVLGTTGYALYVNYMTRQELTRQLATTRAELDKRQHELADLEEQRQRLTQQYEEAQRTRAASEADVARLTQERQELSAEVAAASQERATASAALNKTETKMAGLRQELASLVQAHRALETEKQALGRAVMQRDAKSLTPAELEQISHSLSASEQEAARLSQRVDDLSRAYEQLAQDHRTIAEGIDAHPPEPGSSWASQLAAWATGLRQHEDALAARYNELGEGYLTLHNYARAAGAFEKSLELHDDPAVHAKLALLYSRFLHAADRASQHAAASSIIPSMRPGDAARAQRMPRGSWQLLRDWLTQ